jgi:glycosyltransferase involved in cell wall biosynthesis
LKQQSQEDLSIPEPQAAQNAFSTAETIPEAADAGVPLSSAQASAIDKDQLPLEAEPPDEAPEAEPSAVPSGAPAKAASDRPSILYCVPASVLDITSGAALSQRTLLMSLVARGFRAVALEATIFDSPQGGEHVLKAGEAHKDKALLRAQAGGIDHFIVRTKATRRPDMTCAEQEIYLKIFRDQIHRHRPDMVFVWGGMLLEMTMMREAREAGIPVVFYLVNGGYKNKETFKYVSVIVTDTAATASLYKERLGLDCKVLGKFIDPELVKPKVPRRPDFITFINPSFEKGVSLFMPLAKLAAQECPEIRFLVVQSRGRWGNALQILKFKPEDFPNVKVIGHQRDMRPVYASTRALLLPSLWHESGARVIAEAQLNGIPIMASNTGGSPELVGRGGVIFDVPQEMQDKKTTLASQEVVRPWLEEIKRLWHDPAYYEAMCRRVEAEAVQHDVEHNTQRFIDAVSPAVLASKGKPLPGRKPDSASAKDVLKHALARKQQQKAKRGSLQAKGRGRAR